jgi:hypothetical protein
MIKNYKAFFIIIMIISFFFIYAKDKDPDKKKKNDQNKEERSKEKDKKGGDNRAVIHANENFIAEEILGRPTDKSITINFVPAKNMYVYFEYGTSSGGYSALTSEINTEAGKPTEILIEKLSADTRYYYLMRYKLKKTDDYFKGTEHTFMTRRSPGRSFAFALLGDTHPERDKQNDPELYKLTMLNIQKARPDFFLTIGDDFSVDILSEITTEAVTRIYLNQRYYLGIAASSAPVFLVNGNHEQAAKYILNGTANNNAVWAQNSRNQFYPQPAPDDFYSGDTEKVEFIGFLRDYYSWTWGDALFITIDPYWHSDVPVDNVLDGGEKRKDLWGITLGDKQYQWFKNTLEQSRAKYKFVFTHHVLGTGRGGIEMAGLYEWGGKNKDGTWEFDKMRPGWEMPIHQLMTNNNVTIFFQGHDHIFVKQELDGIIYQELPEPADPEYTAYNEDAYKSGDKFPNSGFVKVTVSNENVKVDYIRSYLSKDQTSGHKNGELAFSYTVKPK